MNLCWTTEVWVVRRIMFSIRHGEDKAPLDRGLGPNKQKRLLMIRRALPQSDVYLLLIHPARQSPPAWKLYVPKITRMLRPATWQKHPVVKSPAVMTLSDNLHSRPFIFQHVHAHFDLDGITRLFYRQMYQVGPRFGKKSNGQY